MRSSCEEERSFGLCGLLLRSFIGSLIVSALVGCTNPGNGYIADAELYAHEPFPIRLVNRSKFDETYIPSSINGGSQGQPGTVIIDTAERFLYLIETSQTARRYRIAVGAAGHAWHGEAKIGRKSKWPAWYPTDDMHAQAPGLPKRIEPGPANPLGARALYLYANGVDTLYRIHGTSEPWTIGTEASSGCIRMFNEDVIDLFDRVQVGAKVIVRR